MNNFRTLGDYEYLQLINSNKGLANQYRFTANYNDLDFLNTILRTEELRIRIAGIKYINIPEHNEHTRTSGFKSSNLFYNK